MKNYKETLKIFKQKIFKPSSLLYNMAFKINISDKTGKTYHLEAEAEEIIGKDIHDKIEGKEINSDLDGYEFEITGASDKAGFAAIESVEGIGLKKVLLTYGKAMHKKPKGLKKKNKKPEGLRLRKTLRGKTLSQDIVQINLKVLKHGKKHLSEIFPEQNKTSENTSKNETQE